MIDDVRKALEVAERLADDKGSDLQYELIVKGLQAYLASARPAMGDDVVERLYGLIEGLAHNYRGFLPDIDDPNPSRREAIRAKVNVADIKTRQMFIEDTEKKAKAALAAIPAGAPAPADEAVELVNELIGELDYDCSNWPNILSADFKAKWQAALNQQKP